MIRFFVVVFLFFGFLAFGDEVQIQENPLTKQIKTLIDEKVYEQNKAYIKIIFSPESNYYKGKRVDVLKVVKTLKDNGLLELFFKRPRELTLSFKTSGAPLFFVKIMGDTLRNIGYYKYVTTKSALNASEFVWTISLNSEYATDPLILQKELQKRGCSIVAIERESAYRWSYVIDMREGHLNLVVLHDAQQVRLKRSLYAHWLDVSKVKKLTIRSSSRNSWYPYIAYYDPSLHLLKVLKIDEKRRKLTLNVPNGARYLKVSDIYTLKNIKDSLILTPRGTR